MQSVREGDAAMSADEQPAIYSSRCGACDHQIRRTEFGPWTHRGGYVQCAAQLRLIGLYERTVILPEPAEDVPADQLPLFDVEPATTSKGHTR